MQRFADKTVFVTGASRGIGRAIAVRLGAEGARVGIGYRADEAAAQVSAEAVRTAGRAAGGTAGGSAECFAGDVRDEASVAAMVAAAERAFGTIDVWVNNAGIEIEEPPDAISVAHWDETFAVNVRGVFLCARAAAAHMLPRMSAERPGVIVNISSRFGFLGDPGSLPYGASKAAVNNLTKALAKLWAPAIRVNGVAPAYTETDLMAHVTPEYVARFHANTPLKRVARPEDTAAAVAFLASDDAAFTTGQTLLVDGGYALK